MTDSELLELAAKAAGIDLAFYDDMSNQWYLMNDDQEKRRQAGGYGCAVFDPLDDDGDALRLAVKLNIWPVRQYDRPMIVVQRGAAYFDEIVECEIEGDELAATRRAIVLAAAELGKEMP